MFGYGRVQGDHHALLVGRDVRRRSGHRSGSTVGARRTDYNRCAGAATAANEWMIPAWRDVYRLAPAGAKAMGRTPTLQQIKRTCTYLRQGTPAAWVVDSYFDIALASGTTRQQQADMVMYSTAVLVVATKRLCPSYTAEVWAAISAS